MTVASKTAPRKTSLQAKAAGAAYEVDFYTWTQEQARHLREGELGALDLENLAEEIATLGRSEYHKLVSFYRLVLLHMLKWEHQPNHRSVSWATSIRIHRERAASVLSENPGLKARLDDAFADAYRTARLEAVQETGLRLATFPEACPFTRDEMLQRPYDLI